VVACELGGWLRASQPTVSQPIERALDTQATSVEHVRVHHRRAHIGMAEQFLDGPDIRPGLEEVRCERVPEGVARPALREPGPARSLGHRALDRRLVQMKAGWRSEPGSRQIRAAGT